MRTCATLVILRRLGQVFADTTQADALLTVAVGATETHSTRTRGLAPMNMDALGSSLRPSRSTTDVGAGTA